MHRLAITNEADLERRFTRARDKSEMSHSSCSIENVRYTIPVHRTEGPAARFTTRPQRRGQDAILIIVTAPSGVLANKHSLRSKVERMFY